MKRGMALIELLVAMGIMAVILPALITSFFAARGGRVQEIARSEAVATVREAKEALRVVRDSGWTNISPLTDGTIYHPAVSSGTWHIETGVETIDAVIGLTRQIVVGPAYRDGVGNLVTTGGILDPSVKHVTITANWGTMPLSTISSEYFLMRFDNLTWLQTTTGDFDLGSKVSTLTTSTGGGAVILANNNKAKWCSPAFSSASIDLPDGPPVAVAARSNSVSSSTPNDVVVATSPTATNSAKMAYVTVTANTDPPAATLMGTFTLDSSKYSSGGLVPNVGFDNNFKTNDIKYYTSPSGALYALMTTTMSDREVIAVKIRNSDGTNAYQDSTSKIYSYWTSFNTKIYGASFNNPSSDSPETNNAGDNNGFQTSPTRAYLLDGQLAVDTNSGSGTGTNCGGSDKDKHTFYDYDISVPSGATINGIETSLVVKTDSTTGSPKLCAQVSGDGGATWSGAQATGTLSTTLATYKLGGSTDLWGKTWSDTNFSNANFRLRIIMVASNTSRDFSLDYAGVKVYYNGISTVPNDVEPFGYGAKSLTILNNKGYVSSGGYLYAFDLSTIDSKSSTSQLDQVGCRIQLDGYDCKPGSGTDRKYNAGETGSSWSDTTSPAHNDCSDGGNIELYATNHLYGVTAAGSDYIYVAVGAGTNPEFEIVNVTSPPDALSNPAINAASCGRISGGGNGWKVSGSLDFNSLAGTEEAANSIYASSDGSRAYISSNGGIDGNNDGQPDSDQFYILDTSNKSSPKFLSGTSSTGAQSGYYNGDATNIEMHPRRSLTVLNGERVVLVGVDAVANSRDAQEYQVLNNTSEATPAYCGGLNYDQGFNDLTSVSEADGDNFVYMVANTTEKQLKIIEGGPDSGLYVPSGTFDTQAFDAGHLSTFNRFDVTATTPSNTSVQYQVAVAAPSGSCSTATYDFVGPDKTSTTKFSGSGQFPLGTVGSYTNPGQCVKIRTFLSTSDSNATPTLEDILVNYSP